MTFEKKIIYVYIILTDRDVTDYKRNIIVRGQLTAPNVDKNKCFTCLQTLFIELSAIKIDRNHIWKIEIIT